MARCSRSPAGPPHCCAGSGRYGYHRDELYFLAAGRHLDWGFPDQPPLVPGLARLVSAAAPDSLVALRLPSAVMAGVAAGGSGSSVSRAAFLPLVVPQVGPWLLPIWLAGLVRLLRDATLRCLGVAFLLLLLVFLVSGGKP